LLLLLLKEYVKRTGDFEDFKELQSNVDAALWWIDKYGDKDGDSAVEYHQCQVRELLIKDGRCFFLCDCFG